MAQQTRVTLTSSWTISGDTQAILSLRNSSTTEPSDEPSEATPTTPLTLTRPTSTDSEVPCYLHIQLSSVSGRVLSSLELVSESRTMEVYSGEEYLTTVRGVLNKTAADDVKLYSCVCDLPRDTSISKASLKLLSLRDKTQVTIHKVHIDASQAKSSSVQETSAASSTHFLSSISTEGLPPFLRTLVSSLQSVSEKGSDSNGPSDLAKMGNAFRQMQSVLAPPAVQPETLSKEPSEKEQETVDTKEAPSLSQVEQDRLLNVLEERLKIYVDNKFTELEQKLEARFEEMLTSGVTKRTDTQPEVDCNGSRTSGLVEDSDQLD